MNKVIIMRGLPGSGKSRWVRNFVRGNPDAVVCSADDFFMVDDMPTGILRGEVSKVYRFDPTKLSEAHNECFNRYLRCLEKGTPIVIVDNTNIHHWEYRNYERVARMLKYEVEIVQLYAETTRQVQICIARNNHRVPGDIIARLAVEFEPCDTMQNFIEVSI